MMRPRLLLVDSSPYDDELIELLQTKYEVHEEETPNTDVFHRHLRRVQPAVLLVGLGHRIGRTELELTPQLRVLACPATGTDHIDEKALSEQNIQLVSLRGRSEELRPVSATAELSWAILLNLARRLSLALHGVQRGEWRRADYLGVQLRGRVIAVIGYGRLGSFVGDYARTFGMRVLVVDPHPKGNLSDVEVCDLSEAIARADVISLHVPLQDDTRHLINESVLRHAKRRPLVVNTSRGDVVDETAIAAALRSGLLSGYGTDVLAGEREWIGRVGSNPITPLIAEGFNVVVTPHIGGYTADALHFTRELVVRDLLAIDPQSIITQ
ncbi:MAG: 2-hydroxyacid dehydrogenase [Actinomycetota bacterium]